MNKCSAGYVIGDDDDGGDRLLRKYEVLFMTEPLVLGSTTFAVGSKMPDGERTPQK